MPFKVYVRSKFLFHMCSPGELCIGIPCPEPMVFEESGVYRIDSKEVAKETSKEKALNQPIRNVVLLPYNCRKEKENTIRTDIGVIETVPDCLYIFCHVTKIRHINKSCVIYG